MLYFYNLLRKRLSVKSVHLTFVSFSFSKEKKKKKDLALVHTCIVWFGWRVDKLDEDKIRGNDAEMWKNEKKEKPNEKMDAFVCVCAWSKYLIYKLPVRVNTYLFNILITRKIFSKRRTLFLKKKFSFRALEKDQHQQCTLLYLKYHFACFVT